jgi:hypothetical protein
MNPADRKATKRRRTASRSARSDPNVEARADHLRRNRRRAHARSSRDHRPEAEAFHANLDCY